MIKLLKHCFSKKATSKNFSRSASKILNIKGREVLDSSGCPTIEAEVTTELGKFTSIAQSESGEGSPFQSIELRDSEDKRYNGLGVKKAVQNVNEIIGPALLNRNCNEQFLLDTLMVEDLDGSKNDYGWRKANLGSNAILAVSLALTKAGAAAKNMPLYQYFAYLAGESEDEMVLPVPQFGMIAGGRFAANEISFQEFTLMPTRARSYREALQIGVEIYLNLKEIIQKKNVNYTNVGVDGGLSPNFSSNKECLDHIMQAVEMSGHLDKVDLGIDAGATAFYDEYKKSYDMNYKRKNSPTENKSSYDMIYFYEHLLEKYPIVSIEDAFHENDWEGYQEFMKRQGKEIQIVADDLIKSNTLRISEADKKEACNCLLLKVSHAGTVTDAIKAFSAARNKDWSVVLGQRSGENEDSIISDIAVGLGTGQVEFGGTARGERTAKHNQLLRIEEELGSKAVYAGEFFRTPYKAFY